MEKPKLLIIEDDDDLRVQMKWALAQDYEVLLAGDRPEALEAVRLHQPAVATLDLGLPPAPGDPREGFQALADMLAADPFLKVVVITGQGEKENALAAVRGGAYDFFCKPVDADVLRIVLNRAFQLSRLERENRELQKSLPASSFEGMVGSSRPMQKVFEFIRKVAPSDTPVLLLGESGTGKELAARAIHRLSPRREGPFVAINCGAIPDNLLESELFGHEKGAFTGAHIQRQGRIESAQGGTLFLDEIGDIPLLLQVKLLRFLQEQQIERVGGRKPIPVDTRVISATNADLRKAMTEGRFREDLYYRIGVVNIAIAPLRDREGDVLLLAKSFLQSLTDKNRPSMHFSKKALDAIERHSWPGNVRELENRLRRAVIMAEGNQITPADLELEEVTVRPGIQGLAEAREAVEREMITRALAKNKGNLSRTAEELRISRPTLYELIDKLGISRG